MFVAIQLLPEICAIKTWTKQQKNLLSFLSMEWEWIGRRLDFLLAEHSGTRPQDPLNYFYSHFFDGAVEDIIEGEKEDIRLRSNYLFALFLVINEHWTVIQSTAKTLGKDFRFLDPKTLFYEICRQISLGQILDLVNDNPGIVSGINMSETRKGINLLGKFCRGTHPEQEKLAIEFLNSPWWGEYVLAAVRKGEHKYLRNSYSWKRFLKEQKQQERLGKGKRTCLLWNQGIPIYSQSKKKI
jgi:hypothetical protein